MKIALTGSAGRLGQALCQEAQARGHQLLPLTRQDLDITAMSTSACACVRAFAPQVMINCAAFTAVAAAQSQRRACFAVNTRGVQNLIALCQDLACPVVQISSDYVLPPVAGPHLEVPSQARRGQLCTYGATKLYAEKLCLQAGGCLIVRTGTLFGPQGDSLVARLLRQALNGKRLTLIADNYIMPTPYALLAQMVVRLVEQGLAFKAPTAIVHATGPQALSVYAFARQIFTCACELGRLKTLPAMERLSYLTYAKQYPQVKRPYDGRLYQDELVKRIGPVPPLEPYVKAAIAAMEL